MKKPIAHVLVKRKFFTALLFLFIAFAGNAQWTYTTTVKQTGRCIPYPTLGPIPYYTKSACEAARQYDLSNSGSDWSTFGDGSCTTIITCTPCTGSDIGTPGQGSTSGQSSLPGQVNPGDISINGILEGKPFFTPHQSQAFEEWASEYKQLLASYGITSILGKNFNIPRTPLTEDKYFNAAYTNMVINFNPKTAPVSNPPVNDPNVVDLRDKKGVVDIDNQSVNTTKTVQLLNSPGVNKTLKGSPVPLPVPGEIKEDTKHEYIDLTREHLVTLVGIAPGALGYVSIAAVNIWAENAKAIKDIWDGNDCPSSKTILVNALKQTAIDEAMQGLGSLGGSASGKLFASIADRSMIKKGVLPGIEGVVKEGKIAEIGEAHFGIVSVGTDAVKKIMNAWGISTAFDDPK
jgi:hypothetical protein